MVPVEEDNRVICCAPMLVPTRQKETEGDGTPGKAAPVDLGPLF